MKVDKKKCHDLRIEKAHNGGFHVFLDDKELSHVEDYKIEKSTIQGKADLSIKILVNFPITQESTS